jgi:nitrogen fixation/metabolism regulation signal transduction histidine kinase
LKQLTQELAAQESQIWKKVIRVIAHELNNSLAPISSLAHSGRALANAPDPAQLTRVFRTIEERASHLASFIDGYARFSKLPKPRLQPLRWTDLLERVGFSTTFRIEGELPRDILQGDAAQLEQMLINLLKNASESGSTADAVSLQVSRQGDQFIVQVADRGAGLAPDVLANALLPFFSTKASGTGIGLTLCREIIEAHGGRISLANRDGGGALVTVWLPLILGEPLPASSPASKLAG